MKGVASGDERRAMGLEKENIGEFQFICNVLFFKIKPKQFCFLYGRVNTYQTNPFILAVNSGKNIKNCLKALKALKENMQFLKEQLHV